MSAQDGVGAGAWESDKQRLTEKWNAEERPRLEAIYRQRYLTRSDWPEPTFEGEIPKSFPVLDPEKANEYARSTADSQLEEHLKIEKKKIDQKEAAEQKEAAAKKDEELKQDAEEKRKQIQAQLESVRRPEELQQQSYAALRETEAAMLSGKEAGEKRAPEEPHKQVEPEPGRVEESKQAAAKLESVRRPEELRQQSYAALNETAEAVRSGREAEAQRGVDGSEKQAGPEPDQTTAKQDDKDARLQARQRAIEEYAQKLQQEMAKANLLKKDHDLGRG